MTKVLQFPRLRYAEIRWSRILSAPAGASAIRSAVRIDADCCLLRCGSIAIALLASPIAYADEGLPLEAWGSVPIIDRKEVKPDGLVPPTMADLDEDDHGRPVRSVPVLLSQYAPAPIVAATRSAVAVDVVVDGEVPVVRASNRRAPAVHLDDAASANGFVDARIRTLSLAMDAVVPRSSVTIQPRVQLAYQPRNDVLPNHGLVGGDADSSATGLAVRLYGAQPTRIAGIYPFVEADWWQDSRKQTFNINGTKFDADILRGLFSFNVGAHGSTANGVKLWVKVKGGSNKGGLVGARYRW